MDNPTTSKPLKIGQLATVVLTPDAGWSPHHLVRAQMKSIVVAAVAFGVLSIMVSQISSPSYGALVTTALVFGFLSITACAVVLIRSSARRKWAILLVLLPVLAFTIDNVGRLMHILGAEGFRILI
jgi:hypothetical protein